MVPRFDTDSGDHVENRAVQKNVNGFDNICHLSSPQLPQKSPEPPEVEMILQDDSPAVQELQDEEMEVEVEGETARLTNRTGNSICSFLVETDLLKLSPLRPKHRNYLCDRY